MVGQLERGGWFQVEVQRVAGDGDGTSIEGARLLDQQDDQLPVGEGARSAQDVQRV
jgi:hypothetical protein